MGGHCPPNPGEVLTILEGRALCHHPVPFCSIGSFINKRKCLQSPYHVLGNLLRALPGYVTCIPPRKPFMVLLPFPHLIDEKDKV